MTEWFQLRENLEDAIAPVILDNNYSRDTAEMIVRVYSEAHDSIMKIPDKLKLIAEEQSIKNPSGSGLVSVHDIARYTPRIAEKELAAEVHKMPNDHAAVLELLMPAGEMCYSLLEKSARIPLNWLQRIIPIVEREAM